MCGRYGHKKYVCLEFGEKEGIHKIVAVEDISHSDNGDIRGLQKEDEAMVNADVLENFGTNKLIVN